MTTTEDRHSDKSRRFATAILEVLRWEADGIYQRSDTKTYTCMCAALGEVMEAHGWAVSTATLAKLVESSDSRFQPTPVIADG